MNKADILRKVIFVLVLVAFIPLGVFGVKKAVDYFTHAGGVEANLVVDMKNISADTNDVWRNLAQGGEESGQMLAPVIDQVRKIRPKYIRIDHIYDLYNVVSKDPGGSINFDWSRLDRTIDDITAIGATPFISISYTPPAISSGNIVDLPASWSDWELVVQKTIEHISGRDGKNIANVYYEVWNEPDLFGDFKVYGKKNYIDLYAHSVAGASRASNVNSYKFGGPATTALYKSWFDSLLTYAQNNRARLDFFSWHRYSKNLDDFDTNSAEIKDWLIGHPGFQNIELVISEMGPNSENDPVYDNYFSAIHTMAVNAGLQNSVNKIFNFEIKDGPGDKQYWGRWGIFTHEKFGTPVAKPRYASLQFLNNMSGNNIPVLGQGSWVKSFAKKNGENPIVKIFVVNYDPQGKHTEAVPITLTNLENGNFTFRRTDYSGKTDEELVATTSGTWSTLQEFTPNSASIFEIIPK